ncbi:MAG: NUDIX domain-containing protein [Candidatus Moranbacteria bacterium]|jgi:8-oxo-dGTP diphosphatase|nr:NUDIX domain-containing protein [Candidatus Moranbacteria bacterium]MBP9801954.1 NUDIX domain-containing protein [Candidatus Moranbacteria bacterium]
MEKKYIDKLAWIYIQDQKILSTRSCGKDTYYIPGGKRNGQETDQEALIREVKEELTVDILSDTIKHVGTFEAQAHGKPEGTVVRMTCYSSEFTGDIKPAAEIEEIVWFTHKDKDKSSLVDKIIFDYLAEKQLII